MKPGVDIHIGKVAADARVIATALEALFEMPVEYHSSGRDIYPYWRRYQRSWRTTEQTNHRFWVDGDLIGVVRNARDHTYRVADFYPLCSQCGLRRQPKSLGLSTRYSLHEVPDDCHRSVFAAEYAASADRIVATFWACAFCPEALIPTTPRPWGFR